MPGQDELKKIQEAALQEVAAEAVEHYKKAIIAAGIPLTGDLLQSFQMQMANDSGNIAAAISFMYYGRYRDMKTLGWTIKAPPVDDMVGFIEKTGLEKFVVWGTDRAPANTKEVRRLAYLIGKSFMNIRKKRKHAAWYNKTTTDALLIARKKILEATALYIAEANKKQIENG